MHPSLERCLAIVLDAAKDAGAQFAVRRDPARWSPVEIVEHLTRAYSGTAKGFERCLEKGAPLATAATLKQRLQQFALINLGYFPEGRQAPKYIMPTGELDLAAVLDAVRRDLARLDEPRAGRGKRSAPARCSITRSSAPSPSISGSSFTWSIPSTTRGRSPSGVRVPGGSGVGEVR